jgi:hypothetical protein
MVNRSQQELAVFEIGHRFIIRELVSQCFELLDQLGWNSHVHSA